MEGLNYEDDSPYWYKYDDAVQPNATFTYIWTVNAKVGPLNSEPDCRIWTYYSGVNPVSSNMGQPCCYHVKYFSMKMIFWILFMQERDIHSGLIGPLLICKKDTLAKNPVDTLEFILLFMTFDENKSWYFEQNWEILKKTNKKATMDPNFNNNIKFHGILLELFSVLLIFSKFLKIYMN